MDAPASNVSAPKLRLPGFGWAALSVLLLALWTPILVGLWGIWRSDPTLTHGPFVPLLAVGLLVMRRESLREWGEASLAGFLSLCFCCLLFVMAFWADIEFLKPLALIGVTLSLFWYFGGASMARTAVGPLGFLIFIIPWPTTVVERLAFPLQLTSSAYAALFAGMFGLHIQRDGVTVSVLNDAGTKVLYSALVARGCSGLTSLIVLLALGYLVAYFTPTTMLRKAVLWAAVVPLALFTNAVRMTLILIAGGMGGRDLATLVHDNEAPVLIFLCMLGLLAIRKGLLSWSPSRDSREAQEAKYAAAA